MKKAASTIAITSTIRKPTSVRFSRTRTPNPARTQIPTPTRHRTRTRISLHRSSSLQKIVRMLFGLIKKNSA
ncbi:MAG: hypothetical protein WCL32_18895, partial [Planctomycetota bacterium]